MFRPPKTRILIDIMNQFPSKELEEIESECQIQLNSWISDQHALAQRISWMPEVRAKS